MDKKVFAKKKNWIKNY